MTALLSANRDLKGVVRDLKGAVGNLERRHIQEAALLKVAVAWEPMETLTLIVL